jgi:hypothetical protein
MVQLCSLTALSIQNQHDHQFLRLLTRASTGASDNGTIAQIKTLSISQLRQGTNTIAVEIIRYRQPAAMSCLIWKLFRF